MEPLRTLAHPERLRKRNRGHPLASTWSETSDMRLQSASDSDCSKVQDVPNPIAPPRYATAWRRSCEWWPRDKRLAEWRKKDIYSEKDTGNIMRARTNVPPTLGHTPSTLVSLCYSNKNSVLPVLRATIPSLIPCAYQTQSCEQPTFNFSSQSHFHTSLQLEVIVLNNSPRCG